MVPGQASGAQMLKGGTSGAKVTGLMIFAAGRRALLGGTARTSAQLFGKCPPSVTSLSPPPRTGMRDYRTRGQVICSLAVVETLNVGPDGPALNPTSAAWAAHFASPGPHILIYEMGIINR